MEQPSTHRIWSLPLDLLTSVRVGIFLLTVLFVYCSIGSAGVPVSVWIWEPNAWYTLREHRLFEMTEYEWFNWWPFYSLVAAICVVMATTTIRRIPLTPINAGVWMIHTGIIVLSIGCVIYFGTKIEGDVAIARGRLVVQVPGHDPVEMRAMPGASMTAGNATSPWTFHVESIDPEWSLLSGDDAGTQTYAVTVAVERPDESSFMRQVIAGYPQYTEDIVPSGDPSQPMGRAKKVIGTPLVDETLSIALEPDFRKTFYLQATPSLYVRELKPGPMGDAIAATPWIERPVETLPRFNDRITDASLMWPASDPIVVDPMLITVESVDDRDPLAGIPLQITDYLRYAIMQTRPSPTTEGPPQPWASVRLTTPDGRSQSHDVHVLGGPSTAPPDQLAISWIDDDTDLQAAAIPHLEVSVPESDITLTVPIESVGALDADLAWTPVDGTPFSFRVERLDNNLYIAGRDVSMARVSIDDGQKQWQRWVFDDPALNGDLPTNESDQHESAGSPDERIIMQYIPPAIGSASLQLVAGPNDDQLRLRIMLPGIESTPMPVTVGTPIELTRGINLTVEEFLPRVRMETRPMIISQRQRDRAAANQFSMVRVMLPDTGERSAWLAQHHYPFESKQDSVLGFRYQPTSVTLPDGRMIELMLSRRTAALPSAVSLDGFRIATHVGGFTGDVSSVLNWHSQIRFEDGQDVQVEEVSVNDPGEREGLWFFQSQWDPPDPQGNRGGVPSMGRNFTVLGVGNRNGVWTMLAGCILSVVGMIYAFYVKPMLKRSASLKVYSGLKETAS